MNNETQQGNEGLSEGEECGKCYLVQEEDVRSCPRCEQISDQRKLAALFSAGKKEGGKV